MSLEIDNRLKGIQRKASFFRGQLHTVQKNVTHFERVVTELEGSANDLEKVLKVLGKLVDNMVKKDLDAINHLVNYGLRVVFPDRDLLFRASMSEVNSKMQVNFETFDNGKLADNDTHGSVSVVQSLLLRIICVAKTGTARLLLLDETFAALDDDYIIRVGVLLKELAAKMDMDILLATFNASASEADTVIRAKYSKSSSELKITTHGGKIETAT